MTRRLLLCALTLLWMAVWVPPAYAAFRLERADDSAPVKGLSIPATLVLADVHWPVLDAPPKPRAVKVAPAVYRPTGGVWDRLAACESGGRWSYNGGSGFDGGLQHHPRTWTSYRLKGYPQYAWQASREQQIAVAERVKAAQGWGAWPACSRRIGVR